MKTTFAVSYCIADVPINHIVRTSRHAELFAQFCKILAISGVVGVCSLWKFLDLYNTEYRLNFQNRAKVPRGGLCARYGLLIVLSLPCKMNMKWLEYPGLPSHGHLDGGQMLD
jgi:hypothetical protein